jgi:FAD/FMN-containing dehydrogenase
MKRPDHGSLARRIQGSIVTPAHPSYDTDRQIWNARFDRRPAAIVFVAGPDDVAATLDYGMERNLPIAVRGGGHSPAGWSSLDDGIVIDLRRLDEIRIAGDGQVTVGGGTIVADLAPRLDEADLVLPVGTCPQVGIAGLTLSGGLGHLNGCLGLTCDALQWVEIVRTDGRRRILSAHGEPALFWAVRGAGSNFGVVTRMGFQATRFTQGYGGRIAYQGQPVRDLVRTFRDLCLNARDELGLELKLLARDIAIILAFWAGDPRDGPVALSALRRLGEPMAGGFEPMRYAALATLDGGPLLHRANYQRSVDLDEIGEDVITAISDAHGVSGDLAVMTLIHWRHGVTARTPIEATAYPHRSAAFETTFAVAWRPGQEQAGARRRVDAAWIAAQGEMRPVYVGMLDEEPAFRSQAAYGVHYPRLARLKSLYDPENRLRSNANITSYARS